MDIHEVGSGPCHRISRAGAVACSCPSYPSHDTTGSGTNPSIGSGTGAAAAPAAVGAADARAGEGSVRSPTGCSPEAALRGGLPAGVRLAIKQGLERLGTDE